MLRRHPARDRLRFRPRLARHTLSEPNITAVSAAVEPPHVLPQALADDKPAAPPPLTVRTRVLVTEQPMPSVTVRVTVYTPSALAEYGGFASAEDSPSELPGMFHANA